MADFDVDSGRLFEEDDELRALTPAEGAQGKNGSDYRRMFEMFQRLFDDAAAIRSDPLAFQYRARDGSPAGYNDKVINAYAKLMGLAMKGMAELNRMRNNDKMVDRILNENTQNLSQMVSIQLGVEMKAIIDAIDMGAASDDVILRLKRLMHRRVPEIFLKAANDTLSSTREEFGLLQ